MLRGIVYRHGCEMVVGRSVTQLAKIVLAPAVDLTTGGEAAGVVGVGVMSRAYLSEQESAGYRCRPGAVGRSAITQLSHAIPAPAIPLAGSRHPAAYVADSHAGELVAAGYRHRLQAVGGGSVAQLSVRIASPAEGAIVGGDSAAVGDAGGNLAVAPAPRHRHRPVALEGLAVADLAARSVPPA